MPEVRIDGQKVSSRKRIVAIRWTSVLSADRMRPWRCRDVSTRAEKSAPRSHQPPPAQPPACPQGLGPLHTFFEQAPFLQGFGRLASEFLQIYKSLRASAP